jgi:hypothetical protein
VHEAIEYVERQEGMQEAEQELQKRLQGIERSGR